MIILCNKAKNKHSWPYMKTNCLLELNTDWPLPSSFLFIYTEDFSVDVKDNSTYQTYKYTLKYSEYCEKVKINVTNIRMYMHVRYVFHLLKCTYVCVIMKYFKT